MRTLMLLTALLAALPATVAGQQLYRWTDDKGVVNYGDTPPRAAKDVRPVNSGSVSVVPAVPREQIDQMKVRDEERRRQQAKRDADEARAREQAATQAAAQAAYAPPEVTEGYWPDYGYWPTQVRPPPVSRPRPLPPVARPQPLPAPAPLPLGQPPILPR